MEGSNYIPLLDKVKTLLNLSINQLVTLTNSNKKTIYDWYENISSPNIDIQTRLTILISVIESLPSTINIYRLKSVWKINVNNITFIMVFHNTPIDLLKQALISILNDMNYLLVNHPSIIHSANIPGDAHLAEFDRVVTYN